MVQGSMDLILGSDRGGCAIARSSDVEGVLLQAVYVLEAVSDQSVEIDSFLPATPMLIQVDQKLAAVERAITVDGDGESWWVRDNERLQRDLVPAMIAATRAQAEARSPGILDAAKAEMRSALDTEVERLCHLQAVNDHVRDEEIDAAKTQIHDLALAMDNARLRLDSLRLVVGV